MHPDHKAYLLTAFVILGWAGAATAFKIALQHIEPLELLAFSASVSVLVLGTLMIVSNNWRKLPMLTIRQWLALAGLGVLNPFLYYLILFQAYDLLPGQVAMSLNYLWPVMLAVLSVPILGHSINRIALLSLLISFAGAVLIATQGQFSDWSGLDVNGVLLALASTLVWALYWLLNTHLQIDTSIKLSVGFLSGSILTWVYILFTQEIPAVTMKLPWLAIAYVGLLEMGVTFFIWLKALQLASSAARLGQMIYLAPFFSLLSLWIFLDEEIYPSTIAGLLIIIGGIVLHRRFQAD